MGQYILLVREQPLMRSARSAVLCLLLVTHAGSMFALRIFSGLRMLVSGCCYQWVPLNPRSTSRSRHLFRSRYGRGCVSSHISKRLFDGKEAWGLGQVFSTGF